MAFLQRLVFEPACQLIYIAADQTDPGCCLQLRLWSFSTGLASNPADGSMLYRCLLSHGSQRFARRLA